MSRRRIIATVLASTVGISAPAWAFFSLTSAASTATYGAGSLSVTSASASQVSSTALDIAWVAPATNPASTTYKVVRDGTTTVCAAATASPCHDTGLVAGSAHSYTVTAQLGTNWESSPVSTTSQSTANAPTVESIDTADASISTTLHWTVTFSAAVDGVDKTDFALVKTGGSDGTVSAVSPTSGLNTSYSVTVTGASVPSGASLGLNLVDNDSIKDAGGTPLVGASGNDGSFTGQTYSAGSTVAVPSTPQMLAADDSGSSNSDNVTSVTTPRFTGTGGTVGNTISLYFDGASTANGTATVQSDGTWSVTPSTALSGGPAATGVVHTVVAKESSGTVFSAASSTRTFTVDTVAPAAPTATYSDQNGNGNADIISGTAEPNAAINITETTPTSHTYPGTAGSDGTYSVPVEAIGGNQNRQVSYSYSVVASDAAGNPSPAMPVSGNDTK